MPTMSLNCEMYVSHLVLSHGNGKRTLIDAYVVKSHSHQGMEAYHVFAYEMHMSHFVFSHRNGKPTLIASLTTAVPVVLYQDCSPPKHCPGSMSA